ncbi:DUF6480 family protein [Streptomyces griseoluteus]|uniref:DUF6480 family protein n=1 Tax=Streptomyces griseoluteus TaxID=29306 RepID=UPI003821CA35
MTSPEPERPRVPPTESPPAEGSTSAGISHAEPRRAWGPVPLTLIMLVVALVAVGLLAMAVALMR